MALTLIEINKTVTDPVRSGVIETIFTEENFFQYLQWRDILGLALPYSVEDELPGVGFRNLNEAFAEDVGVIQNEVEVLKPFGLDSDADKVLVDAYGSKERASRDAMSAKAVAVKFMKWFFYGNLSRADAGTGAYVDAKGFDGLATRLATAQTVDALGTGGTDGSSVFAVRFGDGYCQGLQTPAGISTRDLGELQTKPCYRTRIDHTAGFAIFNSKAAGMIKDLRAATQVLTWTFMDELADLVPNASVFAMASRSRRQLKASCFTAGTGLDVTLDQTGNPIEAWGTTPISISDAVLITESNS